MVSLLIIIRIKTYFIYFGAIRRYCSLNFGENNWKLELQLFAACIPNSGRKKSADDTSTVIYYNRTIASIIQTQCFARNYKIIILLRPRSCRYAANMCSLKSITFPFRDAIILFMLHIYVLKEPQRGQFMNELPITLL